MVNTNTGLFCSGPGFEWSYFSAYEYFNSISFQTDAHWVEHWLLYQKIKVAAKTVVKWITLSYHNYTTAFMRLGFQNLYVAQIEVN